MAIIAAFYLVGELLHALFVPLPGSVNGLILLSTCLFTGAVKIEQVEDAAGVLLQNMLLFFAPAIVGILAFIPLLKSSGLSLAIIWFVTMTLVMLSSALAANLLMTTKPEAEL